MSLIREDKGSELYAIDIACCVGWGSAFLWCCCRTGRFRRVAIVWFVERKRDRRFDRDAIAFGRECRRIRHSTDLASNLDAEAQLFEPFEFHC